MRIFYFNQQNLLICLWLRAFSPKKIQEAVVAVLVKKVSLPSKYLKNYGPVSGLCFMSNLVEWVVVKQHMQHINSSNLDILSKLVIQLKLLYCILKMISICHCHLVSLLYYFGLSLIQLTVILFFKCIKSWFCVCSMALKWLSSYLSHQFQANKIGSNISKTY